MTMMEKEQLIYPLTSLVAEFGGTLGLFLGFSFMTVWDGMQNLQGLYVSKLLTVYQKSVQIY